MKKLESGRSMVEMLGVLAIIGVLSIGGIAGYTLSMRRYRANQVLDAVNKYSLIVYGACQQEIINNGLTAISNCATTVPPSFADAGLGSIGDAKTLKFVKIDSDSGQDSVKIQVEFADLAVCKAAKSIVGSTASSSTCTSNKLTVPIKQN